MFIYFLGAFASLFAAYKLRNKHRIFSLVLATNGILMILAFILILYSLNSGQGLD